MTNLDSIFKSRDITLPTKVHLVKASFSSGHVWMWRVGLWRKLSPEELMLLNCGVGEDSWESLGLQGDQPVHSKGDHSWVFFGRTPILWPPYVKSWLIWKDSEAGRGWGQEEKGTREDKMAGLHHQLDAHEFGWTPGVGDGQGGLVCCDSWGRRVRHDWVTELNWTEPNHYQHAYPKFCPWFFFLVRHKLSFQPKDRSSQKTPW